MPKPCDLCGSKHWPRDPHVWPGEPKNVVANKPVLVANAPIMVANTAMPLVANRSRHGVYKDAAKRRDYMRAYMTRYRSKGAAQ